MGATANLHSLGDLARKSFYRGTHRLVAPEQTLARVSRLMPVMGITRIANVTGLDRIGVPVVMVCRPNSRSLSVSQGKGLDLLAAKASGLMESLEGYHAEHITLQLKLASYEELRYTHTVVEVSELPQPTHGLFHANSPLLWIEGYDLLQEEPVWIPYEMVHLNYTLPLPPGTGCFVASSNGLASGNHMLEAVSHGLCEVVERDCCALWTLRNRDVQDHFRLDLDSVNDQECREVLERCERAGVSVAVWEITSDIGIPAFFCMMTECSTDHLRPLPSSNGSGCHPAREVALLRALTEAAQARLTYISGSRDDIFRMDFQHSLSPDIRASVSARMEIRAPMRSFRNIPTYASETFESDVAWELERLCSSGVERAIVVDLTKPEFRIPVARVVIPRLEPFGRCSDSIHGRRARAVMEGRA